MLPITPLSRIRISIRQVCKKLPREKIPGRRTAALAIVLFVVLLAGRAVTGSTKSAVLYRFHGGADGASPGSGLVADKTGILYGTTGHGGGSSVCFQGCGTVFDLVPPAQAGGTWTHRVLYSFTGSDAIDPYAALVLDQAGNLYGTAPAINSGGVLYQLAPPAVPGRAWTETVLHTFIIDSGDGWNPTGKLVFDQAGNLYGVTTYGGGFNAGTVYELSPPAQAGGHWTETLLHDFTGGNDGANPGAGFIFDRRGNLYGTASAGGTGPCNNGQGGTGCGVVFALKPPAQAGGPWTESVLYNFQGGTDEASPASELIFDRQGNLYGTSILTVYEVTPPTVPPGPWTETTLYSFPGGITGTNPSGAVIFDKAGNLYGNAVSFGIEGNSWIYTLAPPAVQGGSWTETTLFNFPGGLNSASPYGALISGKGGALYGTTSAGGVSNQGTVFSFVP